jgi:tetratricopeptide (TPR) repeat protein
MLGLLNETGSNENSKNLMLKLLSKKADSFEKLEKFSEAFLVYESLMKIDSKFNNVQQSYNRIRNVLKENGQLNKIIASTKEPSKPIQPQLNVDVKSTDNKVTQSKEEMYEANKVKGNEYVKESKFEKAIELYTKCIEIDSSNPVAYLNRSLCYIKCNNADLALEDSNFVLKKDNTNVKALFRRAISYKMKLNYDLAIEDLKMLVTLEKNNQIAIQELEEIKKLKKDASKSKVLDEITPSSSKKKIVVLDENMQAIEKKPEIKEAAKPKATQETNKNLQPKTESVNPQPTTRKVTFTKVTNAYEFLQLWNSINPKDINAFTHLLVNVQAADLPKFIGSKLDDAMLATLLKAIEEFIQNKEFSHFVDENRNPIDYLKFLAKSQRFNVIKLFLNQDQKQRLNKMLLNLKSSKLDDLNLIKKDYDL